MQRGPVQAAPAALYLEIQTMVLGSCLPVNVDIASRGLEVEVQPGDRDGSGNKRTPCVGAGISRAGHVEGAHYVASSGKIEFASAIPILHGTAGVDDHDGSACHIDLAGIV